MKSIFRIFGLQLVRLHHSQPVVFLDQETAPMKMHYLESLQPIVITASLSKFRALPIFTYSHDSKHPFVIATKQALNSKDPKQSIRNILEIFYQSYQPDSAASLLSIEENSKLNQEPAWAAVMPWNHESLYIWKNNQQKSALIQNSKLGLTIGLKDGWSWCGPVSDKKLNIEVERLYNVFNSIKENGYKRDSSQDGDIQTYALINKDDWVLQTQTGQHRSAVLSGLGYDQIPTRVTKTIYRSQVDYWPNVISGLYSRETALAIFDNVFNGKTPNIANNWLNSMPLDNDNK
jgi:hypothetical protein